MADIAQRVLMNEFKQLSKEKWTNIEVRRGIRTLGRRHLCKPSTQLTAC
jgi:hypothetical protein